MRAKSPSGNKNIGVAPAGSRSVNKIAGKRPVNKPVVAPPSGRMAPQQSARATTRPAVKPTAKGKK